MLKIYTSCLCVLATVALAKGQSSSFEKEQFNLHEIAQGSNNSALLNELDFQNLGESKLYFRHTNGTFKHTLLAKEANHYGFESERYQKFGDWRVYGKFGVEMGREIDVPHTTQLDPLRINPYIVVDSLSGDWNKQAYVIETKIASPVIAENISLGLGLKYHVATGARQRDPRPQNTNNELVLTPSISYKLDTRSVLGLTGTYRHFVEDFNVRNINTMTMHNLYKLIGVGEYVGSSPIFMSSGGITRQYNGDLFGGGLQYSYTNKGLKALAEGYYNSNREKVTDGTIYPQNAGEHAYAQYGFSIAAVWQGHSLIHRWDLLWDQKDVDNTEFHQYQDTESKEYVTLFSDIFNTNLVTTAALNYQLAKNKEGLVNWETGVGLAYSGWDNRYASNYSQQTVDRLSVRAHFNKYFHFEKSAGIRVSAHPEYSKVLSSIFAYDDKAYSTNFVAQHILYPANAFMGADYWKLGADIQYNFKKSDSSATQFYVKMSGLSIQPTGSDAYFSMGDSRFVGQVALGLLSF